MLPLVLEKLPAQAFAVKVSGEDKQNKTKKKTTLTNNSNTQERLNKTPHKIRSLVESYNRSLELI